ncbi:MAG: tetratricopeptide repeat protein [Lutibacter sp.]|uniref:tetratricopeptide repeat protein n=1 Tax=Lutibacter sp. TaxID=1925666 RepID=UPI0019E89A8B|nr:tetratricopeptide repeat protein [Lutibacter sp.]NOR28917.1 tetratricopeptide repeat protein [Lutibacter sp.]
MKKIIITLLFIIITLNTEAQSSVFNVVDSLLLKGNYQKALVLLENETPKTTQVFDKIATINQTVGNYNKAIHYFEKALKIENSEEIKVKLGVAYNSAGLSSKSILIYEEIIKKDTSNLLVANSLGKLYLAKSKVKEAVQIFRFLNKNDSLNPNYPYQIAQCLAKQNKKLAMKQSYLKSYNLDTLHIKSIYELAKFFKELKYKDSTLLFIDKGLKIDSINLNFLQLKANVLYFLKNYKGAIEYLTKLDSLNFKSVNTYEMFGMCYFNLKEFDLAEHNFKRALKLEPNNSKISYRLGTLYYEKKEFKLAQLYIIQSIMYGRGDLDKQFLLAGVMAKEEFNLKVAINYFRDAVKYNRDNVNALFQLAFASDSYFKDKKIALKHYKDFVIRFEGKNKKLTDYANSRIKQIRKEYFMKGEIVE